MCNLADEFADYFMGKIENIRESLKDFENFKPTMKSVPKFDVFEELSEEEIKKKDQPASNKIPITQF